MNLKKIFVNIGILVFVLSYCFYGQILSAQNNHSLRGIKPSGSNQFKAGAAISNITPFLGGGIVGGWNSPPATHIHDDLHARCLVLDDGKNRLVFVIVDNIMMNRDLIDEAKRIINEETKIPKEFVLVSAIHTHSATSSQGEGISRRGWSYGKPFDDYQKFLIRRIADVVRIAINNLEPARIGWGVGSVPQHVFNRRWKMKPGTPMPNPFGGQDQVVMNPGVGNPNLLEPAGPTDPDVSFISVQSKQGKPIAVLANYSLHYVGGVPAGHISADYFAVFADRLQELLKADRQDTQFVGIMSNGTSGDVNNINFRGPVQKNPPYAKIHIVANDVAQEVFRVYKSLQYHDWVRLQAAQDELTLRIRKPSPELAARSRMVMERPDTVKPVHVHEKEYASRTLQLLEWPDKVDIVLQVFRIGDLAVATIPFETFAETGLEIKAKSPFKPTFTIELANGSYGYLPTPDQHKLGGYETWLGTNRVETEASRKIVSKLLELFTRIK
jgi:hypothetical protein